MMLALPRSAGYSACSTKTPYLHRSERFPIMASDRKVRVAIVGLGFGAEFIPIYQNHPNADMYAICRRNEKDLNKVGDEWKIQARYTDYDKPLADPNVDAVHINSPIPDHAPMTLA